MFCFKSICAFESNAINYYAPLYARHEQMHDFSKHESNAQQKIVWWWTVWYMRVLISEPGVMPFGFICMILSKAHFTWDGKDTFCHSQCQCLTLLKAQITILRCLCEVEGQRARRQFENRSGLCIKINHAVEFYSKATNRGDLKVMRRCDQMHHDAMHWTL